MNIIYLRPDARHDDVPVRPIMGATPWTVIVIINAIFGDVVNLGMEGIELVVERLNGRAFKKERFRKRRVTFAEGCI